MSPPVVTFDAGQTLIELDLDFLARRLGERDIAVDPARLAAAEPGAWRRYDALVEAGYGHPWQGFMTALLEGAGIASAAIAPAVGWLYREQPTRSLWRKPIAGMIELARALAARGVRVAVLSNSEGGLAAHLIEIGLADPFEAIVDSGRIGIEKPDPRIFAYTLDALGVTPETRAVHVGDSWAADVAGAVGAGWRAVWFRSRAGEAATARPAPGQPSLMPAAPASAPSALPRDVTIAHDAREVGAALHGFGV